MTGESPIRAQLLTISMMEGVEGCALVEASTGLVWHATGRQDDLTHIAEAATDHWRNYQRHETSYRRLGALQAQVLMFAAQRITIVSCGRDLVHILFSDSVARVDWSTWRKKVSALRALVEAD